MASFPKFVAADVRLRVSGWDIRSRSWLGSCDSHTRGAGSGATHPTASISPGAVIEHEVDIGPYVTVGAAKIGRGSVLHAGVVVGDGCVVGEKCLLHPHVVLYPGVQLGDRVVLHAG